MNKILGLFLVFILISNCSLDKKSGLWTESKKIETVNDLVINELIINELENKQPCQINHTNGQVMIFNGFIPHQTIREGNEVRLSLEFRIKTKNPYKDTDKWRKYNNHARYWFLPNGKENDFFQRLKYELLELKKFGNYQKLISLRNKDVQENLIFSNL